MLSLFLEIIMTNSPFSVILGRICLAVPYKYSSCSLEISLAIHKFLLGEISSINSNVSIILNGDSYNIVVEVKANTLLFCFSKNHRNENGLYQNLNLQVLEQMLLVLVILVFVYYS